MMHIPRVRNCGPSRWSARWKRSPTWPGRIECFSSILSTQGKLAFVLLYWAQRASKHIIWKKRLQISNNNKLYIFLYLGWCTHSLPWCQVDSEGLEQLGEGGAAASLLVESRTQSSHSKSSVTTAVPAEPLNPATEALRWSISYIFTLLRKKI